MVKLDDRVSDVFDEIFNKLETDSRIQTNPPPAIFRHEPVFEPRTFPSIFFVTGSVRERRASTHEKFATLSCKVDCFDANRDPTEGTANIEDLVKTIRRVMVETKNDRLLVKSGSALAQEVRVSEWGWSTIGPILETDLESIVFSGIVNIEIDILVQEE